MRQFHKLLMNGLTLFYIAFVALYFVSHPTGAFFQETKTHTGNLTVDEIIGDETETREEEAMEVEDPEAQTRPSSEQKEMTDESDGEEKSESDEAALERDEEDEKEEEVK